MASRATCRRASAEWPSSIARRAWEWTAPSESAPIASAETTTTLNLVEANKGSTFVYVDNNPTTTFKRGEPKKISAGDEMIITNPIKEGSKTVGKLRAVCTATTTEKKLNQEWFTCEGIFSLPKGTLSASALISFGPSPTEGAILGGTGIYKGARGAFVSKEGKSASTLTISITQ